MRTAAVCPTCSTFTNALCVLYNGPYLSTLNIAPLDNLELVIQKIETFASVTSNHTHTFLSLTDVPYTDYVGQQGKLVKVNATEDGLIFGDPSGATVSWGDIQGTLSLQTDLQSALDGKVDDSQVLTNVPAGALFTDTIFTPTSLLVDYSFTDNSTNWNTAYNWGDHSGLYLGINTQLPITKTAIPNQYFTSYDSVTGLFTSEELLFEVISNTPVENYYPSTVEMIADQVNQTANYFQYIIDTDTYYEYLGTTVGDITDYRELTVEEQTILKGKQIKPVHLIYADATALYAAQKKQIEGFIYRTSDNDNHFEYLGTTNGNATDYKPIGVKPTGLEAINEGNGIGWRLIGRAAANYGNIGLGAIDFSTSTGASTTRGALGAYSFTQGRNNSGLKTFDTVFGDNNTIGAASSGYSTIFGDYNTIVSAASSVQNFVAGYNNSVGGFQSYVFGDTNNVVASTNGTGIGITVGAKNYVKGYITSVFGAGHSVTGSYTTAVGLASNVISDNDQGNTTVPDRTLFVVGNGTVDANRNALTRSNALSVSFRGIILAPSLTTTLINAEATGKVLVTREWVTTNVPSITDIFTKDNENFLLEVGGNYFNLYQSSAGGGTFQNLFADTTFRTNLLQDSTNLRFISWDTATSNSAGLEITSNGLEREVNIHRESSTFRTDVFISTPIADTTLNFPAKAAGTYTLATTSDIPNLQQVTDAGNTTTLNIVVASVNDLKLFNQTGVSIANIGIGTSALQFNSGTSVAGVGYNALSGNTGSYSNGFGYTALSSNTGSYSNGFGNYALYKNKGTNVSGVGDNILAENVGDNVSGLGSSTLSYNTGSFVSAIGNGALQRNIGSSSNGLGYNSLSYNTGNYANGIGRSSLYNNTGSFVNGFGGDVLYFNQGNNNTALGYSAYSTFLDNTAGNKTFDFTDIDEVTDRITITAHGFGSTGTWVNLRYTQGTSPISGWSNTILQAKIIDANTLGFYELISATNNIYHGVDITAAGTGTGHTFTPQFVYNNVTVLGANSEPTKSNQVVLGDANVVEVVMGNGDIIYPLPAGFIPTTLLADYGYTEPTHAFSEITSKPTTLLGYGISDTKANFNTALSDGDFVFKVGTASDNQVAIWTGDGTLEGTNGLSFNGTVFTVGTPNGTFNTTLSIQGDNGANGGSLVLMTGGSHIENNRYLFQMDVDGNLQFAGDLSGTFLQYDSGTNVIAFPHYGDGTKTGAPTYSLAVDVDGNVIETALPTGGTPSPLTTKGDIYTFSTVDARLPVGTNGKILSANSATITGLEWIDAPTGGAQSLQDILVGTDGTYNFAYNLDAQSLDTNSYFNLNLTESPYLNTYLQGVGTNNSQLFVASSGSYFRSISTLDRYSSVNLTNSNGLELAQSNNGQTFFTTVRFATPIADVTLNFPAKTAGTYTLATTADIIGGGDMLLGTIQTVTAKKTFNTGTIGFRNPANTFSYNLLGSAITADRSVTLPLLTGNDTFVMLGLAQTLTSKTLTSPVINTQISGTVTSGGNITTTNFLVGATATQSLTNKTVNGVVLNSAGSASLFLNQAGGYTTPPTGGDVYKVGTPANNQVGFWTGDGTLAGTPNFEFNNTVSQLSLSGAGTAGVYINDGTSRTATLSAQYLGVDDWDNDLSIWFDANTFRRVYGSFYTELNWANPTANRTQTFQDASGTIALTSDIIQPLTTKGDLFTFSTVPTRLGVGTNGQVLTADSAEITGMKWADSIGGSGTVNYYPRFGTSTTLQDGRIKDDGTRVLIGDVTVVTEAQLTVIGSSVSGVTMSLYAQDGAGIDNGGAIAFGGHDGSIPNRWFANMKGGKENATASNYAGYLSFNTRVNGGSLTERMRITSAGEIDFGVYGAGTITGTPTYGLAVDTNGKLIEVTLPTSSSDITLTAGETLTAGDVCYLNADGKMYKADASAEATSKGLIMFATSAITINNSGNFRDEGSLTTTGLTVGSTYYISTTAGAITLTKPSAAGEIVRVLGYATTTTNLRIRISETYIEV